LELLIVILVVPGLGGLMLLCRHWLLESRDRNDRETARRLLGIAGWVTIIHAVGFGGWMVLCLVGEPRLPRLPPFSVPGLLSTPALDYAGRAAISAARLLITLALAYAGWAAVRVSAAKENPDASLKQRARESRDRDALLLGIIVLLGLPLLIPGTLVLIVFWGFVGVEYAASALIQRGRQNRLLWTLVLAARHGRPLADEVEILSLSERPAQRNKLQHLVKALRQGTSLSRALLTGPSLLPIEIGAAIQAGEEHGQVEQVLSELAIRQTREIRAFRWDNSLNSISLYIAGMVTLMLIIVGFLMYYIVPKYKAIMNDFGVELPPVTVSLIQISDLFVGYWFLLIPVFSLPFMLTFQWMYLSVGQARWIPSFVRSLWPRLAAPMVLRSLGAAATAQEQLAPVMESLADVIPGESASQRYRRIGQHLWQGEPLSQALLVEQLVTPRESKALERAEQLHHLPWTLEAIADRIEFARWRRIGAFLEWLKPISILSIGAMVLFICLGMFSPLIKLLLDLS
jgi:type II secretory pathway component PulF